MDSMASVIERAFETKNLKAVALVVNSPGGSPVQSSLIAGRIRALADENDVPVIAFAEDAAASGGYWLACAADEIFADAASIIGSIGVISAGFGFTDLIKKIGVERRVYAAGTNKSTLDPFQKERADDVARLRALQDDVQDGFIAMVKERRGDKLADDDELFTGAFWTGNKALELGLIDGIGEIRSTMRARYGDKVKLRVVEQPKSWRRRLGIGLSYGSPDWAAGLMSALEERHFWNRLGL